MFCEITLGMMLYTSSVASLPCSNFDKIETPPSDQVSNVDTEFIPMPPVRGDIKLSKQIKTMPELPDPKRTAIYDISARSVILPSGEKLEAHSGFGDYRDDPSSIKIRMRGPTPPNHYKLSLRERLFHGVKAIRLNPVNKDRMHGRAGILAHPYMLGPRGDSNGCVSVKNYDRFLKQFLDGRVTDMVVVKTSNEINYASKE